MPKIVKPGSCQGCIRYDAPMVAPIPHQKVDILVVGSAPTESDVTHWAFRGTSSSMVRQMFTEQVRAMPPNAQPTVQYTYAARCYTEDKLKAEVVAQCFPHMQMDIERLQPTVIFLLGGDALKAFGYGEAMDSYRGNVYHQTFGQQKVTILPSFHPVRLRTSPGLLTTFKKDVNKCLKLWNNTVHTPVMDLRCPTKFEDIMPELDKLDSLLTDHLAKTGKPKAVGIDTEATSLSPWEQEARMIAVSLGWVDDTAKIGLAFPLDHRKAKLTVEQREAILLRLDSVLNDPRRVALIYHNGKFDEKFLRHAYRLNLAPPAWDTMLGEHLIDEDKKGSYGLKQLTTDWFPGAGKYETELKQCLEATRVGRKVQYEEQKKAYLMHLQKCAVPYWEKLGEEGRMAQIAAWLNAKVISSYSNRVVELEYKTPTKKQVAAGLPAQLYKRAETLVVSLFKTLPIEAVPAEILQGITTRLPDEDLLKDPTFEDIPLNILLKYAAIDAAITVLIAGEQIQAIREEELALRNLQERTLGRRLTNKKALTWGYSNISLPLSGLLTEMEYHGIRLDRDKIKRYQHYLTDKAAECSEKLFDQAGYRFNPKSGPDLCKLLFDDWGLPVLKVTEKDKTPSTDADVLKDLYDKHDIPLLKELLLYRALEKCKSTYLDNWLERSAYDGKLHASFNINGTATFRLSSSNPNLQNVMFYLRGVDDPDGKTDKYGKALPMNLKSVFIPDSEDYDLYDLDIANAEMRTLCAYSRDEKLIKAFRGGMDLHCLTAAAISDYTYDEIKANKDDKSSPHYKLRQVAKAVNFGTIYCMGAATLKNNLWVTSRIDISEVQAQEYLDMFFADYPGVADYVKRTQAFVEKFHFTHTYTGRLRRFPIVGYNRRERTRAGRQGVNARIQTTSAEIVNTNLIDVDFTVLKPNNGRMLLTVHDSMVFQLPKGMDGAMVKGLLDTSVLDAVTEKFPWLPVPWKYDVDRGPNYGMVSGF